MITLIFNGIIIIESQMERDHWEEQGVGGRTILK
jgi:hypothetical protein